MQAPSRLREQRFRAGLSLAELAARVGVSVSTASRWELGQQRVQRARRARYALVLGVTEGTLQRYLREMEAQRSAQDEEAGVANL